MQFNVLGTLEVLDAEGRPVDVGGAQPRAVLAMLLMAADRVVPADTIIDRLWPENPPGSAMGTLQSYISRLRRVLDPKAAGEGSGRSLAWEARGYRLHPDQSDVLDFARFEALVDRGQELLADDPRDARDVLGEALAMWRGPALVEFADHAWARGLAGRLDERRQAAIEARLRADLSLGRHEMVIGELSDLVDQHPLHEGLRELLAIALYRCGRQAEALRAIDDLRRQLVDGLGVDPGHRIRELESQILAHDPALAAPAASAVTTAAATTEPAAPQSSSDGSDELLERLSSHLEGLFATELVGRQHERRMLSDALTAGLSGVTQWVVLEGEPGIGKTRLLEHLASEANERGYNVMWGRCYESGAPPAFWLWLGVLRGLQDPADPLPEQTQDLIDRLLSPTGDDALAAPVDATRFRLFEAVTLLLNRASARQPVMLALDDVQWADPASLELIEFITGSLLGSRVVIACTVRQLERGRNDAVVQALAQISRRPVARRLQLSGLGRSEAAELARLSVGSALSGEVVDAIERRSEGNPFFIGELARLLASEEGLTPDELVRRAAVPAGVRDVIHRRLARLPPATIELVQVAATIGRETSLGLLSRAADRPPDQCIDELDPAFVDRLIVEVSDAPGSISFSHALVREVVLDDLSMLRRSRLHLRVADAIEAVGRHDDDELEIIADHLWQAVELGVGERAAVAIERAAEVALRRFSYETADTQLERAIQLRRAFPPDRVDLGAELDSLTRLIRVRRVRYGFELARAGTPIERAKELARATGRETELTMLLWTEWAGACTSCDFDAAERLAIELRAFAAESRDPVVRATGESAWGILCWHLGRISEAVATLERSVAELDGEPTSPAPAPVPGGEIESQVLGHCFQVFVGALAGDPLPGGSPLPALGEGEGDPYERLVIWVFEALRAFVAGEYESARHAVSEGRAIGLGDSFELFGAGLISVEGCIESLTGDPTSGARLIERGVEMYNRIRVYTFMPFYTAIAARGHAAAGELDEAQRLLDLSTATLERTGELWQKPFVMCAAARVMHAAATLERDPGRLSAAAEIVREAHAVAIAQGAHGTAAHVARAAREIGVQIESTGMFRP